MYMFSRNQMYLSWIIHELTQCVHYKEYVRSGMDHIHQTSDELSVHH